MDLKDLQLAITSILVFKEKILNILQIKRTKN